MTTETITFDQPADQPATAMLLFGLRGVCRALEERTVVNDADRETIGDLAVAADALAKMVVHRMGQVP